MEIKSFDDEIVSCYEPTANQLTLINTKRAFNKSNRLEPYFKFPNRWKFDEKEANKIVLR